MHCQICKINEATIHLTEIKQGKRTEVHVCAHCAHEQGITVKTHMPLNEMLNNLLASQPEDDEIFGAIEEKTCPHCGFSLEHFRKEPRLGCPFDYDVFEKQLLPLIEKAHEGGTRHQGKTPSKVPTETKKQIELSTLRSQLEEAVQREDYETAADLRDKINELE
ncbi:MAG: UvrB/UvrC motif-containing protein [Planctomycetota bacterium]